MTIQICDLISLPYKNEKYEILAYENKWPINISEFNIKPQLQATLSCNLKGYDSRYSVDENKCLLWESLMFMAKEGTFPLINGREAELRIKEINWLGQIDEIYFKEYKDIMKIPYTGGIIIGDSFIKSSGGRCGYQFPHMYNDVLECKFKDGILQEIKDYNDDMRMVRKKLKNSFIIKEFSQRFLFKKYYSRLYKDKWNIYKYFK